MSWKTPIQLHPHSFQYQKELIVSSHHSPLNFDAIYKACLLPTSPKRYAKHVLSALSTHYTQRQYIGMVWRMVIPARFVFISPCDCIRVYNTNSTRSLSASVMCICKKSAAHYRPEVPRGFQEVDSQITWQWPTSLKHRSQYSEGPATGQLDTGFSWFPCVYKQMLRWFPRFQVATTCFSCSPPDLNVLVTNFIFCIQVK